MFVRYRGSWFRQTAVTAAVLIGAASLSTALAQPAGAQVYSGYSPAAVSAPPQPYQGYSSPPAASTQAYPGYANPPAYSWGGGGWNPGWVWYPGGGGWWGWPVGVTIGGWWGGGWGWGRGWGWGGRGCWNCGFRGGFAHA